MQTIIDVTGLIWGIPFAVITFGAAPMALSKRYRRFIVGILVDGS